MRYLSCQATEEAVVATQGSQVGQNLQAMLTSKTLQVFHKPNFQSYDIKFNAPQFHYDSETRLEVYKYHIMQ